ncbi:hypothetical protein HSHS1_00180 [Helicobacter suis HS1]|nr:hypothetical protein HSHS1_00180 [Helicobacter suis HS1]
MIIGYIIGIFIVACVFLFTDLLLTLLPLVGSLHKRSERAYHIRRAMYLFVITFIILIVSLSSF